MFERYTEDARRSIFFARYEAHQRGSGYITPLDILLGVCRDENTRLDRLIGLRQSWEMFRTRINAKYPPGESLPKHTDMPLDNESKRVLAYAAEEAEKMNDWWLDSSYLVLGILREGGFTRDLLIENGVTIELLRERLRTDPEARPAVPDPLPRNTDYGSVTRLKVLAALLILAALIAMIVTMLKAVPY